MQDAGLLVIRPSGDGLCLPYEIGEIAMHSRFVALGYLDEPELTARKFRSGLLGPSDDVPAYLTGDYGYYTPAFGVVFTGRTDAGKEDMPRLRTHSPRRARYRPAYPSEAVEVAMNNRRYSAAASSVSASGGAAALARDV